MKALPELRSTLYPWIVSEVSLKKLYSTEYFERSMETRTLYELPTEFFNHDLMEVNPDDNSPDNPNSLISFISKWGSVFSPYRGSQIFNESDRKETQHAIETTDTLHELLTMTKGPKINDRKLNALTKRLGRDTKERFSLHISRSGGGVISLEEARLSVKQLQLCVSELQEHLMGRYLCEPPKLYKPNLIAVVVGAPSVAQMHLGYKDLQSCDELMIPPPDPKEENPRVKPIQIDNGQLTNAICKQIVDTINNPYPWRKCAKTDCETIFKHEYPKGKLNQPHTYCCKRCRDAQSQRNRRHGALNHIDHGL